MKDDLEREREARRAAEQQVEDLGKYVEGLRAGLGAACARSLAAMHRWDAMLTTILDGDTFTFSFSEGGKCAPEEQQWVALCEGGAAALLQTAAVCEERVQLKLVKAAKIRALFEAQGRGMQERVQQRIEAAAARCELLHHRSGEAAAATERLKSVVERDQRLRSEDAKELRSFREELFAAQAARLRESELLCAQLANQLKVEQQLSEETKRTVDANREEITSLQRSNVALRADLEELHRTGERESNQRKGKGHLMLTPLLSRTL